MIRMLNSYRKKKFEILKKIDIMPVNNVLSSPYHCDNKNYNNNYNKLSYVPGLPIDWVYLNFYLVRLVSKERENAAVNG